MSCGLHVLYYKLHFYIAIFYYTQLTLQEIIVYDYGASD